MVDLLAADKRSNALHIPLVAAEGDVLLFAQDEAIPTVLGPEEAGLLVWIQRFRIR